MENNTFNVNNLRKLEWTPVDDWSELGAGDSILSTDGKSVWRVRKEDMLNFLEHKSREVARKLNAPFKEVYDMIFEENKCFVDFVNKVFGGSVHMKGDEPLENAMRMLKLPKVDYSAKNIKVMYDLLSEEEKSEFSGMIN